MLSIIGTLKMISIQSTVFVRCLVQKRGDQMRGDRKQDACYEYEALFTFNSAPVVQALLQHSPC